MTDYSSTPYIYMDPVMTDMIMCDTEALLPQQTSPLSFGFPSRYAISSTEAPMEVSEQSVQAMEGLGAHYIPSETAHDLHAMEASVNGANPQVTYPTYPIQTHEAAPFDPTSMCAEPGPAAPKTMAEFFQLMSQPEHVQAYMQFLQTQHEQAPAAARTSVPPRNASGSRSRSSSQPTTSTYEPPIPPPAMPQEPVAETRERKLAKYRAKRARRLTSSAVVSNDSMANSGPQAASDQMDLTSFMPSPKIQKTLTLVENRLMSSEEEIRLLRCQLESRDAELQILRQAFDDSQRQLAILETTSNASSSACTSPRPRSPSTPATMVSSPSAMSMSSATLDTEFSVDTSSMGSEQHMMELAAAQARRQEALKKLGGPPSDVYHPWFNGVFINHPAFHLKEDWGNIELRPHEDLIARERLNYVMMMQRYKMELARRSSEPLSATSPTSPPHSPHPLAESPFNAAPPGAAYQSPHVSHIQPGTPYYHGGFWSGHFAPSTTEKIDLSKSRSELRKTSRPTPMSPVPGMTPGNTPSMPVPPHGFPPMAYPMQFNPYTPWVNSNPPISEE